MDESKRKIPIGPRLSETAVDLIKALADHKGVSQAAVLEMAVREMAKREGVQLPAKQ
jgi:hypothetical protein